MLIKVLQGILGLGLGILTVTLTAKYFPEFSVKVYSLTLLPVTAVLVLYLLFKGKKSTFWIGLGLGIVGGIVFYEKPLTAIVQAIRSSD